MNPSPLIEQINISGLRVFGDCPRLFFEQEIEKTYTPPDKDYFTYGTIVDLLLSGTESELEKRFILADRKVDTGDTLKLENDLKALHEEMYSAKDTKGKTMHEKAEAGSALAMKGIAKRTQEMDAIKEKLRVIKNVDTKTQVTKSLWNNAHETAEVMRQNPGYKNCQIEPETCQVELVSGRRRGTADYMRLSPMAQTIWNIWKGGMCTAEEMRLRIAELPDKEKYGTIKDWKTTAGFSINDFNAKKYAAQLWYYREIVLELTGILCRCETIVGDKDPKRKMVQDFVYSAATLNEAGQSVQALERLFWKCVMDNVWPSAKQLDGLEQKCFRCSECSDRPFSHGGPCII